MASISNNKQIAKNTLFLYLRMFLTMAVSLYTVRVVIQTLSVQDYGIYGSVGGVILSFGFISGVLTNASQRYFSFELGKGSEGKVRETFSTIFFTYIGICTLIILLAETVGLWFLQNKMTIPEGRENAALWVFQFALLSFIVTIMTNPFQAMIIAYEKMNLYAYMSILDVTLKLLIVYALLFFDVDKLQLYAVLMFTSCVITNSIYVIYCRIKYADTRLMRYVDKGMLKSIFSYSSWTLFGTIAGMCNTQGMNLVLNVFFGPVANAAYSVSSQIYHTVGMFANNFYVAVKPPLIKNYSAGNFDYVQKLFTFSSKTIFVSLFVVILPIFVYTQEILQFWLGQVGDYMVTFVKLSLVYTIILTVSYPITAVVQASGKIRLYHGMVDGFSILALPIMYVLFRLGFNASYAYVVSVIIFGIAHLLRLYVLKKIFLQFPAGDYFLRFIIPSLVIAMISYLFMIFIKQLIPEGIAWTIVTCGVSWIVVLLLSIFLIFNKSERRMVLNMIRKRNNINN
ncbi:MAG: lipopolysaccharide biosynthesis protein [Bacteroides graminisolvens]|nr:lipopolysaccharide biosynthesis protein [Bacteroides graminisolvens]